MNTNNINKFGQTKTIELLDYLEAVLKTKYAPSIMKENVFNRVRVLTGEGFKGDVALSIAMKENNLLK